MLQKKPGSITSYTNGLLASFQDVRVRSEEGKDSMHKLCERFDPAKKRETHKANGPNQYDLMGKSVK
jgi:hypothetical protein